MAVPLVLASASPRRAEVLKMLGLSFTVSPAGVEEHRAPGETPLRYVERLSQDKARAVAPSRPGALTIAGDTIVVLDGGVLEKPADREEAAAMLASLSGRVHSVHSGLALARGGRVAFRAARARVAFRDVGRSLIDAYLETGEPLDKAGGYGIQGCGSALVERIEGDYFAVVGLSVAAFVELLPELELAYRPGKGVVSGGAVLAVGRKAANGDSVDGVRS